MVIYKLPKSNKIDIFQAREYISAFGEFLKYTSHMPFHTSVIFREPGVLSRGGKIPAYRVPLDYRKYSKHNDLSFFPLQK